MEQPRITSIGKYEILSEIGRGGMGVVYRAQDPFIGRLGAIKVIAKEWADAVALDRRKIAFGDHPNILPVFEIGEHDGQLYVVMQFKDGDPLVRDERQLSLLEKIDIIRQVCAGLGIHVGTVPFTEASSPQMLAHAMMRDLNPQMPNETRPQ